MAKTDADLMSMFHLLVLRGAHKTGVDDTARVFLEVMGDLTIAEMYRASELMMWAGGLAKLAVDKCTQRAQSAQDRIGEILAIKE